VFIVLLVVVLELEHPGAPPINLRFEKTNGWLCGFMSTNVQSFKCAKSKVPIPEAKLVKSLNGRVTVCFWPGVV
jgi:hypothetical protein